jgi:uncharacterized damage-inducible protein DinB
MKKFLGLLAMMVLLGLTPGLSAARNKPTQPANPSASEDKTPPSYDMKAQALVDLQVLHKRMVELAQAIPADKYTWRPEAGTRSISEVFLHVTATNHNIPALMASVTADETFKARGFETSTTDKEKIVDELDKSFAYAEAAIQAMANADFARPEKKLGPDANSGDVIYILVTDNHEHFGQSIAYARMNGITPPWTAEAEKKAKEAKNGDAPKQN